VLDIRGVSPPPFEVGPTQPAVPVYGYAVPGDAAPHARPGADPLVGPDYAGWWQRSIALVRAGWRPLVAVQAVGALASLVVYVPLGVWTLTAGESLTATGADGTVLFDAAAFADVLGVTVAGIFLTIVAANAATIASLHIGVSIAAGGRPDVGAALGFALRRLLSLLGWELVAGFLMVLGVCACVLPGVYLYAVFTLVPVVVAVERTNVLGRCFRLFHNSFGSAVARIATIIGIGIGVGLASSVLTSIVDAVIGVSTSPFGFSDLDAYADTELIVIGALVSSIISVGLSGAVAVLTAPMTLTAYADLRARREPLSATVLAAEVGVMGRPIRVPPYG
jgi:hypothetical protein